MVLWIVKVLIIGVLVFKVLRYVDRWFRSWNIGSYDDKYVAISGCDSGFGFALARHLDDLGFHVFAGCLNETDRRCLSVMSSGRLVASKLDVTQNSSVQEFVHLIERTLPADKGLWALVNNAGISGSLSNVEDLSGEDFNNVLEVNLYGTVEMTRLCLPLLRISQTSEGQGRIVNMSSMMGRLAQGMAPFCVSQFALEAYSDVLRRELYKQGIKVSLLEPGWFKTNFFDVDNAHFGEIHPTAEQHFEKERPSSQDIMLWWKAVGEPVTDNITPVVEAYTHAITSRFPRNRYVIGKGAAFVFDMLSQLPDWLIDILTNPDVSFYWLPCLGVMMSVHEFIFYQ